MNKFLLSTLLTAWFPASGAIFNYSAPGYAIPDGNLNGVWSSINVNNEAVSLSTVSVTINVSGGHNADLYAYLNFQGRLVPLLNRAGVSSANHFGANGAGMNVFFTEAAEENIHAAGNGYLTGAYRPDGQNISPLSSPGSFNATGGNITLNGTLGGLNPNGIWTLFVADVVSSGNPSTLNSWSLQITAVPEPSINVILAGLAFIAIASRTWKSGR